MVISYFKNIIKKKKEAERLAKEEKIFYDNIINKISHIKTDLKLNESYTDMVDYYLKNKNKLCIHFNNSSFDHSIYIICAMLLSAKKGVCFLIDSFNKEYIKYIIPILKEISENVSVKIITSNENNPMVIYKLIDIFSKNNIEYLPCSTTDKVNHFLLVDRNFCRKEFYNEDGDIVAKICFDSIKGEFCNEDFDSIWRKREKTS